MTRMTSSARWLALWLGLGSALHFSQADSITLQNGTVIEGKILQADDQFVTIETRFSETITEAQRFPRAEVRQVQRKAADSAPYEELAKFPLPEDALLPGDYDVYLQKREDFIRNYGYSSKVGPVRAEIRLARSEQEKVAGGAVKLGGRWLSPAEIEGESQQIAARKLFSEMKQAEGRGDLVRALNLYLSLEKQYPGSSILPTAAEMALATMEKLSRVLTHEERNFAIQETERERGIALSSPADQEKMRAARQRDVEKFQARVKAAEAAGEKFLPYFPAVPESVKKVRDTLGTEQARLRALPLEQMRQSNTLASQARASLGRGHLQAAQTEVEQALALWPANETAQRLQARIKEEQASRETPAAESGGFSQGG